MNELALIGPFIVSIPNHSQGKVQESRSKQLRLSSIQARMKSPAWLLVVDSQQDNRGGAKACMRRNINKHKALGILA